MENASKALVIAGAILISILIIGLGVFIYNGAASTVSQANLNSQEAQAQNQQFEAYFGDKKSAAEVKQLCSLVRSNNITSDTGSESKQIAIYYSGSKNNNTYGKLVPSTVSGYVVSGRTYHVGVANDSAEDSNPTEDNPTNPDWAYYKSGFIRVISIMENGTDGNVVAFP
ncbi:MAG: hypothetical protein IKG14_03225 [Clostridia bacterium]|nr:hypothetical protein [Clostridia bacterium]